MLTKAPPPNPYVAGKAVDDERRFFGREDVIQLVQSVLSSPDQNAVVLFGQRRIGKTSILLQLRRRLPSPPFRCVYFDLMDRARKPLDTVLFELATAVAAELGLPSPDSGDLLASDDYLRERLLPAAYESLGAGWRPVLLLDEFDVLDVGAEEQLPPTAAARALFPYLRQLMAGEPRLAFVFVVGRKAEELSLDFMTTFKAARYQRVSILDEESARSLVALAERDGSLAFTPAAVDRLLSLTGRHPYFTQLMCQLAYDRAYATGPSGVPTVDAADVDALVAKALEAGENIFEWIWRGLPPAERVIFSAVAGTVGEGAAVDEEELTAILQRSGIRILVRELELAPKTLVEWEMLRRVDGGYSFFVELMRRWVAERKPLPKVKDELDRVNPVADQYYQLGSTHYRLRNPTEALDPLRSALRVNPGHLKARLLLGEILIEQGELDNAVRELEEAYRRDEAAARYPLVRALLARGEAAAREGREDDALQASRRVLEISPRERVAADLQRSILVARGDRALKADDLEGALAAYREAGAEEKAAEVDAARRKRSLDALASQVDLILEREEWDKAVEAYHRLAEMAPEDGRWSEGLARAEKELALARRYAEGLGAMQQSKWADAQRAFADVVYARPDYKYAAENLAAAIRQLRPGDPTGATSSAQPTTSKTAGVSPEQGRPSGQPRWWVLAAVAVVGGLIGLAFGSFLSLVALLSGCVATLITAQWFVLNALLHRGYQSRLANSVLVSAAPLIVGLLTLAGLLWVVAAAGGGYFRIQLVPSVWEPQLTASSSLYVKWLQLPGAVGGAIALLVPVWRLTRPRVTGARGETELSQPGNQRDRELAGGS